MKRTLVTVAALVVIAAVAAPRAVVAQERQLVPIKIASQTPPIFEYVYINYAIAGGFLKKEGLDAKFVGFTLNASLA